MKFGEEPMNNSNENPPQEDKDSNVDGSFEFELDEETSKEMESSIDEIPEIKDWDEKSDKEKRDEIKERKNKIEENAKEMGLELKENIGEIEKQIETFRDGLKEKYEEYAGMEESLSQIRDGNTEETEGLKKMQEILSSLSGIYENQLQIGYLEYWKKYKEDPELLFEFHAKRNLVMNNWETLIGSLKTVEEGEEEVLKDWVKWVKDHPEITLAALALAIAAGATMGALLTPEILAALAIIGGDQITEEAIKEVGPEVIETAAKTSILVAGKAMAVTGAGLVAGATVSAGILGKAISWISSEKNRDDLAKALCGVGGFPGWYKAFGGKEASAKE